MEYSLKTLKDEMKMNNFNFKKMVRSINCSYNYDDNFDINRMDRWSINRKVFSHNFLGLSKIKISYW